jgi:hypothetical protein
MKKIKFSTTNGDQAEPGDRITRRIRVVSDSTQCLFTEKDIRRKIAESASEIWGKIGALRIVINEIKPSTTGNEFDIGLPCSQESKLGFLLFFVTELNGRRVKMRFVDNITTEPK